MLTVLISALLGIPLVLMARRKHPDILELKGAWAIFGGIYKGAMLGFVLALISWIFVPKEFEKIDERPLAPISSNKTGASIFFLEEHNQHFVWYMTDKKGLIEEMAPSKEKVLEVTDSRENLVEIHEAVAQGWWRFVCINPRHTENRRYKIRTSRDAILTFNK